MDNKRHQNLTIKRGGGQTGIYRYAHPELFSDWEKPDLVQYDGDLILYGAGRRGMVAAHCLKNLGIDFICFCDSDAKKHGTALCNHKVISPEKLKSIYADKPILITTNHYYALKSKLESWGWGGASKIFNCVGLFLEIDFNGFSSDYSFEYMCRNTDQYYNSLQQYSLSSENYLADIMFPVTNRCTLRCRECSTYIPYVSECTDFNSDDIITSIDRLLTAYNNIGNVSLYGGEPFLYADLAKLIRTLTAKPLIQSVTIITNGTLLPNKELTVALTSQKIRVRVSDYGKLSYKMNELIELLRKKNIFYEVTNFLHWDLTPTVDILNESDEELKEKVLNCCTIAKIPICINGKLFFCAFSGHYDFYKAVPDYGDNYVDLFKDCTLGEDLRNEINSKFQMATDGLPKKVCRFCKFDHLAQHIPVAEQTTETLHFKKVW